VTLGDFNRTVYAPPVKGRSLLRLIDRVKAGDNEALADLIAGTRGLLVLFWNRLPPHHRTEDMEAVMLRTVWLAARRFDRSKGAWSTFLSRALWCNANKHADSVMRAARRQRAVIEARAQAPHEPHHHEVPDGPHDARLVKVLAAIDRLPIREADIIRRRYLVTDTETLGSIGRSYGIGAERTRQLEERALRWLRDILGQEEAA
jgi:hypothetical protein